MSQNSTKELSEINKKIFEAIGDSNTTLLKSLLSERPNINILDENLMTPLQHAAFKGNKEMVQLLIDHGADVNLCEHQHNYTALHFAGLSGNFEVCLALLFADAKTQIINTVNRTPAQMAAFVGHYNCVTIINNFVPKSQIDYYTQIHGTQTKPYLPSFLLESFHKLLMQINVHPVKIALNTQNFIGLSDHLEEIKKVLELMCEKEMNKGSENNEVLSFKFHYIAYILGELIKLKQRQIKDDDKKTLDITELFTRKMLKSNKDGVLEFMDSLLRECIREFPFRECTLFRQMVSTLTSKDPVSALNVVTSAINGQRGFFCNVPICCTCGEEKPAKKCSKCKIVQYCDRNCQRLHWHWHKKNCRSGHNNPSSITSTTNINSLPNSSESNKPNPTDISAEIQNLLVSQ